MAIKELFYDNRPQVLLDPRASQRIDPRFKFTRNSSGSYVDNDGVLKIDEAPAGQPRYSYDPITKEFLGLLVEPARTNIARHSTSPTGNWVFLNMVSTGTSITLPNGQTSSTVEYKGETTDPNAKLIRPMPVTGESLTANVPYTFSVFLRAGTEDTVAISVNNVNSSENTSRIFNLSTGEFTGDASGSALPLAYHVQAYPNGWYRAGITGVWSNSSSGWQMLIRLGFNSTAIPLTTSFSAWGSQLEQGFGMTSLINTPEDASVTRAADLISYAGPLPNTGSVYIDARAIATYNNDTLLSLKNSSNDKIDLAYLSNTSTYNSLALIANYDGTSKTSLPLPVPTTDRERNIITWGAQNYQYGRDFSRFAASLSSSVPTGLNQLSIGHDAVDPTKAFNGYINTVYAWSGELTPAVAEALVRNELVPIDADTYSPTGPAGALALVINTQGASADGDKTFTLPAESAATDNDIVITWGDDTESGLDGSDAEVGAPGLTHTYPAAGIYPVWVEGQMEGIRYNNIANAADLLEISAWGTGDMFTAPSTMREAFDGCTQMDFSSSARTTNRPDTSAVTDWYRAFRDCESITGTFPAFTFTAATTFQEAWQGCVSMAAFVAAGDQTQNVTNFANAWYNCSGLTAFPQINTSSGENFSGAWQNCSSLTIFPAINTAAGTNFSDTWSGCSDLESFPFSINTAAGTSFAGAWSGCTSLDNIVNAGEATSFPLIDTANGTNFSNAWRFCSSLTSFPSLNFDAATGLASDASNTFTGFRRAWLDCSALADFPPNLFNNTTCTRYLDAFRNCALTAASIENIIVSIEAAGTSNGNLSLEDGTNAGASTWTAAAVTAYDALVARGWTITRNA